MWMKRIRQAAQGIVRGWPVFLPLGIMLTASGITNSDSLTGAIALGAGALLLGVLLLFGFGWLTGA